MGIRSLGGDDIDEALAYWCWDQAGDRTELKTSERQRLLDAAKEVKELLSKEDAAILRIPFFREGLHIELDISREQFEKVVASVIGRTEGHCRRVLNDAGIKSSSEELDAVILVGGSTRIPAVRALVEKVFAKGSRCQSASR